MIYLNQYIIMIMKVCERVRKYENSKTEFTLTVTEKSLKDIAAFVNTSGGTIYYGVDDSGKVVGLNDIDDQFTRLTNMIRDSISPDITLFMNAEIIEKNNAKLIRVEVSSGAGKPYYFKSRGIRPDGVYVRQGSSSVPASAERIKAMIVETDGTVYENLRSMEQELTFVVASGEFRNKNLEFGEAQQQTLGIRDRDGLYTNLGLLLSDQCPHIIKAAVFQGTDRTVFRTCSEFSDSLLKQMRDAFAYIEMHMPVLTKYDGLTRTDTPAVAIEAAREAVWNALIHRDYSMISPTLLSLYSDRIEIVSIGGLPAGISMDTVELGVSVCRNNKLANVFYRLGYVEAYGTGLMKIADSYKNSTVKHKLEVTEQAFKITLPFRPEVMNELK